MTRVYIVLLPHYRKKEMEAEIEDEFNFDRRHQPDLDYDMFGKLVYRIIHAWAVNVDIEEYISLMETLYSRITCKATIKEGKRDFLIPKVVITFPEEEDKVAQREDGAPLRPPTSEDDNANTWEICPSDEDVDSNFEYKYEEDDKEMAIKKFKRKKNAGGDDGFSVTQI